MSQTRTDTVSFTTKGQVVIPRWLRTQFEIEDGTKAIVLATDEGILLKPITAVSIGKARGLLKRKPTDRAPSEEWKEHVKAEIQLEKGE